MAWTKPSSGKSRINTAGEIVSGRRAPTDEISLDLAYDIAGNWRSSHGYPLQVAYEALKRRSHKIDSKALVAKRIKRMPSIAAKLARFGSMQLSTMQDLGGCRAVVDDLNAVMKLLEHYAKHAPKAFILAKGQIKNYIHEPKEDGYRSLHIVYKYNRDTQAGAYKGLRIEMQLRTSLQHMWATAVETIDTFTGQGLKSNVGEDDWKRFFVLVSSAFAIIERCPLVPNTPEDKEELCDELRPICQRLRIPDVFVGISYGVRAVEKHEPKASFSPKAFILTLDSEKKETRAKPFAMVRDAEAALLELEKENKDKPHLQTVMASAGSLRALRKAYPNYYLDTEKFVAMLEFLKLSREEKKELVKDRERKADDADAESQAAQ